MRVGFRHMPLAPGKLESFSDGYTGRMNGSLPPRIYLDNAATSHPKAPVVADAMSTWLDGIPASPGRGAYEEVHQASAILESCRQNLCTLINADDPDQVVFTLNCTDALSTAIIGLCRNRLRQYGTCHVVTTDMDHNSVLRPLNSLASEGVQTTYVSADPQTGLISPDDVSQALTSDTALVVINHGSNVCGTVQPLAEIGARCRSANIPLLVDAAQTFGHRHLDVESMGIDLLAFPGHKGLLGPLGTGGLWMRHHMVKHVDPVRLGGTGSRSELERQPEEMPDRYESGSHNMLGITGLEAATSWICEFGMDRLLQEDHRRTDTLLEGLLRIDGLDIIGPSEPTLRCGVFALRGPFPPHRFAEVLETKHGILGRAGLHCAPRAHRTLGTLEAGGTLRVSIGPLTPEWHIDALLEALTTECCGRVTVTA